MATNTSYDVLHRLLEDAHKYEVLSKRAASSLAQKTNPGVGPDDELAGFFLREIARLSHSQAFEAKRLLAQQQPPQEQQPQEQQPQEQQLFLLYGGRRNN